MIDVTKPFLPPIEEYQSLVNDIWSRNWLTNNGPLVRNLEIELKKHLELDHLLFTTNGTIALQLAIRALNLTGEIITTPFSYVATTSSIVWENCRPVFADIDRNRLTIDPTKIEALITKETTGILATHVYGIPCHVEEIEVIAKKYSLKVIYDAAHAFGTQYKNKSLLDYGDVSTLSTHATKLFHTIEGGAVISKDAEVIKRMELLRNFGHDGAYKFNGVGINGKNSEFHAAMGVINLKHIDAILADRIRVSQHYDSRLLSLNIRRPEIPKSTRYNHSYYPIIMENEEILLKVSHSLQANGISTRRYFFPALDTLDYVIKANNPVCDNIAPRVLCLPMYFNLLRSDIDQICDIILKEMKN